MKKLLTLAFIALIGIGHSGCDLGTYSKRYNGRVGKMTSMANSNKDLADELISVGGGGKIRIPEICYHSESFKFDTKSDFMKARIPGIEIPGFQASYMGDVESGDKLLPFQVYFYFVKAGDDNDLKKDIKAAVNKPLTNTRVSWSSETIEAYDGKEHSWNKTVIEAGLPFLVYESDAEKQINLTGRMDIYFTSNDKGSLIIIFRAPADIFGFNEQHLVDGTLKSIQAFQ